MKQEAIKIELIEWLQNLKDIETLNFLKVLKDSAIKNQDWFHDLSQEEKEGIERGLQDIKNGKTLSHEDMKAKYGL
ncbi:hypothetical protein [Marivirga sp.]|uniref:hypothetical protein n=1 Tax=Marivirga sp. TaxID=2018662 RepID=UPI0025DDA79F|nr:hypothetical protein [Marivirga sp.]